MVLHSNKMERRKTKVRNQSRKRNSACGVMTSPQTLAQRYEYKDYDRTLGQPLLFCLFSNAHVPTGMKLYIPGYVVPKTEPPILLPAHLCGWAAVDNIAQLQSDAHMRKGDFLLCSPIKCGTHWLWEIMSMLCAGTAHYQPAVKSNFWVEVVPRACLKTSRQAKVLNTHLSLSSLPRNFRSDTKVVVVLRNLKDVTVSLYHHYKSSPPGVVQGGEVMFEDVCKLLWYSQFTPFGNIFDIYADLWDNHRTDPNVLIVFYEELKLNTRYEIERVARHMEVPYSQKLIAQISEAVKFDNMRIGKLSTHVVSPYPTLRPAALYRQGMVGTWKNYFTHKLNVEFDNLFHKWNELRRMPMHFI